MKFRKLRITWSVFWGLACVLLVVLWIRSYARLNTTGFIADHVIASLRGRLFWDPDLNVVSKPGAPSLTTYGPAGFGGTYSMPLDAIVVTSAPGDLSIAVSLPTFLTAVIAGLPWMRQIKSRYSLRTLLTATTVVAVVLGAIVYATR